MPRARGDRLTRILVALAGADGSGGSLTAQLCRASVEVVAVDGAAVSLVAEQANELTCSSNDLAGRLAELEFSLGEGPGADSHRTGRPVLADDVTDRRNHWPAFTDAALALGVRSVFAFPLRLGAIRLGTLSFYRTSSGSLGPDGVADALVLSRLITEAVLALQASSSNGVVHPDLVGAAPHRLVIHQATGMVAAQLGIKVGEAFVRLQGHAFALERSLGDVAADVVDRRLRFDNLR